MGTQPKCPAFPTEINFWHWPAEKYGKTDIKVFWSRLTVLDFLKENVRNFQKLS